MECRESNPPLYLGFCLLSCRFVPFQSDSFPFVTVHELRHTAASLMIASGANVKTVQSQLGHKTATMTLDLYGHLFPDDLDDVADKMDELVMPSAKCAQNVPRRAKSGGKNAH